MSSKTTAAIVARDQSTRRVRVAGKPRPIPVGEKALLDYEDVASLCGLPVGTVRQMVREHRGPRLTLVGKHHRFHPKDLATFIDEMRANSGARA
jgi:hypothetical protein